MLTRPGSFVARGHAALEYAIVLALLALVICGGAFALSVQMRAATAALAHDPRLAENVQEPPGRQSSSPAAVASEVPAEMAAGSGASGAMMAGYVVSAVAGTALGAVAWRCCRKPRRARPSDSRAAAPVEPPSESVAARIFGKRQDLWRALLADEGLLTEGSIAVRHVMTRNPVAVPPQAGAEEVRAFFTERGVRHLLVCEADQRLVGVISDRDLHARPGPTAANLMTAEVITVTPDTPLSTAITCLIDRHFSCLPVLDGGRLCGLITVTDLVLIAQCAIQIWLRSASAIIEGPSWNREMARLVATVNAELDEQRVRAKALADAVGWVAACSSDRPCRDVSTAAQEVLAVTSRLVQLIAEGQRNLEERLRRSGELLDASTDAATGLSSGHGLEQALATMQGMKKRFQQPFSLAVLTVVPGAVPGNGNPAAMSDSVLQAVAQCIVEEIRDTDVVARHRPDGFAIVLPRTKAKQLHAACARMQRALAARLQRIGRFTIRLGAASARADEEPAALLAQAEQALAESQPVTDMQTVLGGEPCLPPVEQLSASAG